MRDTRRAIRGGLACAFSVCASLGSVVDAQTTRPRPPNVLLIVADDLGYGDLGSYGPH
jgi:hypothetical protein